MKEILEEQLKEAEKHRQKNEQLGTGELMPRDHSEKLSKGDLSQSSKTDQIGSGELMPEREQEKKLEQFHVPVIYKDGKCYLTGEVSNVPAITRGIEQLGDLKELTVTTAGALVKMGTEPLNEWKQSPYVARDSMLAIGPQLDAAVDYYTRTGHKQIAEDIKSTAGLVVSTFIEGLDRQMTRKEQGQYIANASVFFLPSKLAASRAEVEALRLETMTEEALSAQGIRKYQYEAKLLPKVLSPKELNNLPTPNRGLAYVQEPHQVSKQKTKAGEWQSDAPGAYSDVESRRFAAPVLRFDPRDNKARNNFVKFDAIEGADKLIDRKTNMPPHWQSMKEKIQAMCRTAQALEQNPGFKAVYEFPDEKAMNKAIKAIEKYPPVKDQFMSGCIEFRVARTLLNR